ncbi:MAG TPA: protein kinase [Nannocystis sp.]
MDLQAPPAGRLRPPAPEGTMAVKRSTPAAGADVQIGQTIGSHYTLQRLLGRGPRVQKFLATHRTLHRTVILQLAPTTWADGSPAAARFDEQAKALATLEHPNIAALHDHGREPGRVWVAVEFVEGETLGEYIRRMGRLQLETFVPIAAQVLKGLGGAHARQVVHGDLTAANVMLVEEQGRANYVKLLDLGLGPLFAGPPDAEEDAPVSGEPAYLAPEVILNKPPDARSDVYAAGVLFYHMLSGRLPFDGDARDVLHKHVNAKPPPLDQALPPGHGVPDELITLIHDCLAKNPDNRPSDANEIVERMIDCVPAAMFRLPVAAPRARTAASAPRRASGEVEAIQERARSAALASAVEASGARPIPTFDPPARDAETTQPESSSSGGSGWIIALLLLVGGAVGFYYYFESQKAAQVAPGPVAMQQAAQVAAGLQKAEEFERAGKYAEALAAYEVVLVTDPGNVQAKARVAALKAMVEQASATPSPDTKTDAPDAKGEAPPPDTKVEEPPPDTKIEAPPPDTKVEEPPPPDTKAEEPQTPGLVAIKVESTPKAELFVDGVSKGKTPITIEVTPGTHKLELKAKNYDPLEHTLEASHEGEKTLKLKLKRLDRQSFRDQENAASDALDPEEGVGAPIVIDLPAKKR